MQNFTEIGNGCWVSYRQNDFHSQTYFVKRHRQSYRGAIMAAVHHTVIFKNFHMGTLLSSTFKSAVVYATKFHQNPIIFHWDMAVAGFSTWRMSAILNFRGPVMGSLISACRTLCWSSVETIALNCFCFWQNCIFCTHLCNRQTDGQTSKVSKSKVNAPICLAHRHEHVSKRAAASRKSGLISSSQPPARHSANTARPRIRAGVSRDIPV